MFICSKPAKDPTYHVRIILLFITLDVSCSRISFHFQFCNYTLQNQTQIHKIKYPASQKHSVPLPDAREFSPQANTQITDYISYLI